MCCVEASDADDKDEANKDDDAVGLGGDDRAADMPDGDDADADVDANAGCRAEGGNEGNSSSEGKATDDGRGGAGCD
jgi:hypothetical protein